MKRYNHTVIINGNYVMVWSWADGKDLGDF